MPGTLGMDCIDYRISDLYCTPPDQQRHWTEKLVLLPETHLVYHPPEETGTPPSRASLGLPEDGFVYCCMGNPLKIEPTVLAAWMRILREVPGSVLWLYAAKPQARDNLRRNGWKGHGPIPWEHEPNRGFLRCLQALARAAALIGEEEEAPRCTLFLRDSSAAAADALEGR